MIWSDLSKLNAEGKKRKSIDHMVNLASHIYIYIYKHINES